MARLRETNPTSNGKNWKTGEELGHSVIENEVRRRLSDALASAGVANGRISLEVLFMLPPDFVRAYTKLFDAALREDIVRPGGSGPGVRDENIRKAVKGTLRTRKPFRAGARSEGGKRYKLHWIVRDEHAFKVKASIDRKLARLVTDMEKALRDREEGE